MNVHVLIRKDQNDYGFVDTSVVAVFIDGRAARDQEAAEQLRARSEGLVVDDDDCPAGEWQVSWRIEQHPVVQVAARDQGQSTAP